MNVSRTGRRLAVSGVATAIAAAGLVGASTTAATAASTDGTYACSALGNALGNFTMNVDVPLMPPTAPAGFPLTEGFLGMSSVLTIPAAVAPLLGQMQVTGGHVDDYAVSMGSKTIAAPLTVTDLTPNPDGSVAVAASGLNKAVSLPKAGTYEVKLPKSFTFMPSNAGGDVTPAVVSCVTDAPATLASVTLTKQASSVAVSKVKAVKHTKHAKVPVTVKNEYTTATGKVVVKEGKKTIGTGKLKSGKVTVALAKLKKGTHKVVVKYLGDGYTQASKSKAVKVVSK